MLKQIPVVYKSIDRKRMFGVAIALFSILGVVLLTGVSGWFITVTGLTGMGLISMLSYNLFLPSAVIRILAIGRPLLRYQERFFTHNVTLRQLCASRIWIFRNILQMKKEAIIGFRSSDLTARIVSDVDEMDHYYLGMVVPWLSMSLAFICVSIFILVITPTLFWVVFSVYCFSGVLFPWLAFRLGTLNEETSMKMKYRLQNDLVEYLDGFLELKLYDLLYQYSDRLITNASLISQQGKTAINKLAFLKFLSGLIVQVGIAISILLIYKSHPSASGIALNVFILLLLTTLFDALNPIPELWYRFAKTTIAGERLNGFVNFPEVKKPMLPFPVVNNIVLANIRCSYGERIIFDQLNLLIREKRITIITGPNGAGKSTLLDLISGLKLPDSGLISIGGFGLGEISSPALLKGLSYMEQQVTLFDTSVYDICIPRRGDFSSNQVWINKWL